MSDTLRLHLGNKLLQYTRWVLCLLMLFALSACDTAPKTFVTALGQSIDLDHYSGKWVFINYWAPWCPPCREEIPILNRFANKNSERVLVLGVHLDGVQGDELTRDISDMDIRFPVLIKDPGPVLGLRVPPVVPTTWVLNPHGKAHTILKGPQTEQQLNAAMVLL